MARMISPLVALALTPGPLIAGDNSDQLLLNVSRELPNYVADVDPTTLSRTQLAAIYNIMHGPRGEGDKRQMIISTIEGPHFLLGLFKKKN